MKKAPLVFQLEGEKDRLDKVLAHLMPEESRTSIQKLIKDGNVRVDGTLQKANYRLEGQEEIEVLLNQQAAQSIQAEDIPLEIIYEDDYLLVVNKAAGMVVHPSKGHAQGTLVNALLFYLGEQLSQANDSIRPGIVHRIDKDTSGLLLVAKDDKTHRALSKELAQGRVNRKYTALVNQPVDIPEGKIELPLGRDPHNRLRFAVVPHGKPAITYYKRLQNYTDAALVEAKLITGRTHQIRVHMEYIKHPIVGDPVYRKGLGDMQGVVANLHGGQFLHASTLEFIHPQTGQWLKLESPLPARFEELIQTLTPLV